MPLTFTNFIVTAAISLKCLALFGAEAVKVDRRIPDEYETVGNEGPSGVASKGGVEALRLNPALLAMEPRYEVNGGYHWPTSGRDFYQAGIADSATSQIAAGVSYTGFLDKLPEDPMERAKVRDSYAQSRLSIGVAKPFAKLAVGIGGQFVVGKVEDEGVLRERKGTTLGFGIAGLLTPTVKFGASVENLSNKKVQELAPQTYRVGLGWMTFQGAAILGVDYRQRERIAALESQQDIDIQSREQSPASFDDPEKMVIGSLVIRAYDLLRLLASYGQSIGGDDRRIASGGVGLVQDNFSLYYTVTQPYMAYSAKHAAFSLSMQIPL